MDKFSEIIEHIKKVYLTYERPFIVGYSGGKDSTLTLQLVWEAIEGIPRKKIKQPIYVITTDTLVEAPPIESFILKNIDSINAAAKKQSLPITARLLTPLIEESFWVNLLGKGYPAPSRMFRWCTERLKIEPVDRFIRKHVDEYGEATVVLGARSDESASRSQVLSSKKRDNLGLSKHPTLPAAYVFTPIEKLTTDEVWSYLLSEDNKWGVDNNILKILYANAAGGECPMVLDKTSPSCGNSRFGCWTCTVVQKDITMKNLIDQGETWMKPLLKFRDLLSSTQDPSKKHIYREMKRRDGRVSFIRDKQGNISYDENGKPRVVPGPYKLKWRQSFLRDLLEVQGSIRKHGPNKEVSLISREELEHIRNYWREEKHDWADTVPQIYREVTGEELFIETEDGVHFNGDDLKLLKDICKEEDVPPEMIPRLIDQERKYQGVSKRTGIIDKIREILNEDWISADDKIKEYETENAAK